jgi:nucleotide-binding universal stress UspA family protein
MTDPDEETAMERTEVVVGVDQHESHRTALHWAADEAARRGGKLHVLHAYRVEWPDAEYATAQTERVLADHAEAVLDAALLDACRHAPGLSATGATVRGGPAATLLDAADPGNLTVVGTRRDVSGLTATLVGSTAQQVALHSTGPVVVVRGRTDATGGPVAVGVDGSPGSFTALGAAFEAASARGVRLSVVRAFRPDTPAWPSDTPAPPVLNAETARAALYDELGRAVSTWSERFPDVAVDRFVLAGDAARVLDDVSTGAQLLVIGSRGHGGFAGLLLGSVGLHAIHHADCPVLIAR